MASALLGPVMLIMALAFLVPLGFILAYSVWDNGFTVHAITGLLASGLFVRVLRASCGISLTATAVSLALGYVVALHLARQPPQRRALLMILVLVPFWMSILVKSFAFTIILGNNGVVNAILVSLFGPGARLSLMFNRIGVIVALSHNLVPYVVFPVLASLLAQDTNLRRAAQLMGAGPARIFWRITLPLSLPGVIAAGLMTTVISMGSFVIPSLMGGRQDTMLANLVDYYTREALDWNAAAAVSVILLLLSLVLLALLARVRGGETVI